MFYTIWLSPFVEQEVLHVKQKRAVRTARRMERHNPIHL
jgi:hypothetical protein